MRKSVVEFLVVAPLALVVAARGIVAMVNSEGWVAPKYSAPIHLVGLQARAMGVGYLGLALLLLGVWVAVRRFYGRAGVVICVVAGCFIVGGFGISLFGAKG